MEHGARQNTTRVIAVGFISLGTLLTLSLATNIIQGINNYRLQTEQKVAVTPMLFRAPFAVSQNQADASYIEQLGLSFVALRGFVNGMVASHLLCHSGTINRHSLNGALLS